MNITMLFDSPMETNEHEAFLHLTRFEWEPFNRLAAVSGEIVVTMLLSAASPEQQLTAAQAFMVRKISDANR